MEPTDRHPHGGEDAADRHHGEPVAFHWVQRGGGAVTLSDAAVAQPFFTAPPVGPGGEALAFRLVVDDGQGGACTGAVNVGVPPGGRPGLSARDDGQRYDSTQP